MAPSPKNYLFTSESVTEGHPDKIADQISDGVLDAVMTEDPTGRVACETLVTTGLVVVAGEITTTAHLDYTEIARQVIRDVGYTRAKFGFDADTCAIVSTVKRQSPDIAMGVDTGGAGDHFGSRALLAAIEEKRPRLAVCGHIHESWGCRSQIGETPLYNLGPRGAWLEA